MNFIGTVAFNGSSAPNRETLPSTFSVISDWWTSVIEYYRQEVMTGNYDGHSITVTIIEVQSGLSIESVRIENPWEI